MKIVIIGASGMVGSAVLRECLNANDVEQVLVVGRSKLPLEHPKLISIVSNNLFDLSEIKETLASYDACLFCLGTSIGDSNEDVYKSLNQTLPLAVAKAMLDANPAMSFIYVSGKGTDSTEHGNVAWARIKGKTENTLLNMGFKDAYMLRPALIIPKNGEQSKTKVYRLLYRYTGWAMRVLQPLFPSMITDTQKVGRAMLTLLRAPASNHIIENEQINLLADQQII
ncbi:NAD(P)H-binding protein [Pseudoalteromonas sp.]|uniref:NAD(P)H-binding protein n=1 Tax=Pseudoalteromonas sp. TaxID=53249 RepID=UPI0025D11461|nr:NAD(P)H-binding protein [Pseudoalteromonas sp.]MCH2089913.1 NAD(P)H-binding protein [Pseudoalteromonas sp.]